MSHHSAHAGELPAAMGQLPRLSGARGLVLALITACILGAAALLAHWSVRGAAPAATLSIIGETFDKGF